MDFRGWRINLLCIFGGIVGVIALFLNWYSYLVMVNPPDTTITQYGNGFDAMMLGFPNYWMFYNILLSVFAISFFIGTILTFLTPLGGIIQISSTFAPIMVCLSLNPDNDFPDGELLGFISGIIVLTSLFLRLKQDVGSISLKERLWNFKRKKAGEVEEKKLRSIKLFRFQFGIINPLCMISAIIGLIAFLLPWAVSLGGTAGYSGPGGRPDYMTGFDVISVGMPPIPLFALLFLVGTIIAFVSPIGGFLQIINSWSLLVILGNSSSLFPFGELLGMFAGAVAIGSIFYPFGKRDAIKSIEIRKVLVTVNRS
jgi:hypothetical protein